MGDTAAGGATGREAGGRPLDREGQKPYLDRARCRQRSLARG